MRGTNDRNSIHAIVTITRKWNLTSLPRTLRTGVDLIDREHEYLIDRLDLLKQICGSGQGSCTSCDDTRQAGCDTTLGEMLTELLAYMVEHFRHEENLMVGLPEWMRERHVVEHANIAERFSKLLRDSEADTGIIASPAALQDILTHWLENRIQQWDIPIADCLGFRSG